MFPVPHFEIYIVSVYKLVISHLTAVLSKPSLRYIGFTINRTIKTNSSGNMSDLFDGSNLNFLLFPPQTGRQSLFQNGIYHFWKRISLFA